MAHRADGIDRVTHTGWSVAVTGAATRVTAPEEPDRCRSLLVPWTGGGTAHVVRVVPELVTGYRPERSHV
ncbi:pyridoxamine 5'-phosphate oxidase family protein [Streptomyces sp. NPDC000348]|uniref:pyridoxamine 5'-phosphate oxidase family protein n=1 Tax=Streptomyces sp. NPDC000348 TaxID=3364538 RepID=UPI0036ABB5A3